MWRRYIFKVAPTRKTGTRLFADDSENTMKEFDTKESGRKDYINEFNKKDETTDEYENFEENNHFSSVENQTEGFRYLAGWLELKKARAKDKERAGKEEHIILIGKRGSGIDMMRRSLLGVENGINLKSEITIPNKTCISTAKKEVKGYNEEFDRKLKITSLYSDYDASLFQTDLSSLSISEEYSVVFCFPVSYRFTTEDRNILESYLHHRQREDFQKVTVAFTYSDRLECEPKDFTVNLPDDFKEMLNIYGNNSIFISSTDFKENRQQLSRLLKPFPSKEFRLEVLNACAMFHVTRFLNFKI